MAEYTFTGFPETPRMKTFNILSVTIDQLGEDSTITYLDYITREKVSQQVPLVVALWFSNKLS